MGGMVISQAAEYAPERFRRLIYLAAFLPRDGQMLIELALSDPTGLIAPNLEQISPPPDYVWFRPGAPFREMFYHDCSDDDVRRATAQLVPEPGAVSTTPVALCAERFGRVPRAYIECLGDRAVPLALQRAMWAASPCDAVESLDTSHSPFLSAPRALVDLVVTLSR
jgi:pimeloyl-ACP methyl ester carboxylesterase